MLWCVRYFEKAPARFFRVHPPYFFLYPVQTFPRLALSRHTSVPLLTINLISPRFYTIDAIPTTTPTLPSDMANNLIISNNHAFKTTLENGGTNNAQLEQKLSQDSPHMTGKPIMEHLGRYSTVSKLEQVCENMFHNEPYTSECLRLALHNCGPHATLNATPEVRATVARNIWRIANENGWRLTVVHYNLLIMALGQDINCFNLEEVLETMERDGILPGPHTLTAALSCYSSHLDLEKGQWAMSVLRKQKVMADSSHYVQIIRLMTRLKKYDMAASMLQVMKNEGVHSDADVYTALMQMAAERESPQECKQYMDHALEEGITVTETMVGHTMRAYAFTGNRKGVQEVIERARSYGLVCGEKLYAVLMECMAGDDPITVAETTLQYMITNKIRPGPLAYTRIIGILSTAGQYDKSRKYFNNMLRDKVQPILATYMILIRQSVIMGDHESVKQLLVHMQDQDIQASNKLIERIGWLYRKTTDITGRPVTNNIKLDIFRFLLARGLVGPTTMRSMFLWHPLSKGDLKVSLKIIEWLEKEGILPNVNAYNALLETCLEKRQPDVATYILQSVVHHKLAADTTMVHLLLRAYRDTGRDVQAAIAMIKKLSKVGGVSDERAYFTLGDVYKEQMDAIGLVENLKTMQSKGVPPPLNLYHMAIKACVTSGDISRAYTILSDMVQCSLSIQRASDWMIGHYLHVKMYSQAMQTLHKASFLLDDYTPSHDIINRLLSTVLIEKSRSTVLLVLKLAVKLKNPSIEISPKLYNWLSTQQVIGDSDVTSIETTLSLVRLLKGENKSTTDPILRVLLRATTHGPLEAEVLQKIRDWLRGVNKECKRHPLGPEDPTVSATKVLQYMRSGNVPEACKHIQNMWYVGVCVDRIFLETTARCANGREGEAMKNIFRNFTAVGVLVPSVKNYLLLFDRLHHWKRRVAMGDLIGDMKDRGFKVTPRMRWDLAYLHVRSNDMLSTLSVLRELDPKGPPLPPTLLKAITQSYGQNNVSLYGPLEQQPWYPANQLRQSQKNKIVAASEAIISISKPFDRSSRGIQLKFPLSSSIQLQNETSKENYTGLSEASDWQANIISARKKGPNIQTDVWLKIMQQSTPPLHIWTSAIISAARRGDIVTARQIFRQMQNSKLKPSATAFRAVALAHLKHQCTNTAMASKHLSGVLSLTNEMQSYGYDVSVGVYRAILMLCCVVNNSGLAAEQVILDIKRLGGPITPVYRFYAIRAMASSGMLYKAEKLLEGLVPPGSPPDNMEIVSICYTSVLLYAVRDHNISLARRVYTTMNEKGISPARDITKAVQWLDGYRG